MALPNSTLHRWIVLAVKLLIVAVVLWLVRGTIEKSWNYLVEHPRSLSPTWLVFSGGLYLLALLPEGLFWLWALRALGQDVRTAGNAAGLLHRTPGQIRAGQGDGHRAPYGFDP